MWPCYFVQRSVRLGCGCRRLLNILSNIFLLSSKAAILSRDKSSDRTFRSYPISLLLGSLPLAAAPILKNDMHRCYTKKGSKRKKRMKLKWRRNNMACISRISRDAFWVSRLNIPWVLLLVKGGECEVTYLHAASCMFFWNKYSSAQSVTIILANGAGAKFSGRSAANSKVKKKLSGSSCLFNCSKL